MNRSNSKHIKDFPNTQPNQDPASSDSNTNVNRVWTGPKSVHSFRCNDKLWKAFVLETRAQEDSVCHVMEAIIAGVLGALKENVYKRSTITIENLSVQRVVQRHRRVTHEFVGETNFYDSKATMWKYIPVDSSELNVNGHVGGCGCRDCRRDVLKNV